MQILFSNSKIIKDNKRLLEDFIKKPNELSDLKTIEIINTMDKISKYWISNQCRVKNLIKDYEIGFIAVWTKKSNLEKLIKLNFKNYNFLDDPYYDSKLKTILYARPLGIAVHWVAGNIPLLGIISLFQSLITKNKSILKVPSNLKSILPQILNDLKKNNNFNLKTKKIINKILNSTLVIYADKTDISIQKKLSQLADIRIAWGGIEAVESIIGLPKKINSRDLIFGPKVSLAFVTNEKIQSTQNIKKLSSKIVEDVLPFNQAGCNSPHNLIFENASLENLNKISEFIEKEFIFRSKKNYKDNPIDKYNIAEKKFIYQSNSKNRVISGKNNQWNIFVNNSKKGLIEDPIYCRSIFLSSVKNIQELKKILPNNTQSMGLFVSQSRKKEIIKLFSNNGIDRFPQLGKMSLYENPWDGYLPLQNMVKWICSSD